MPKLRCFIAIAFGHDDTDAVYDKHIKKAIKAVGLEPVRVDKAIYLDRIDAKIRAEITRADITIADLTYARPSVYWEAGYAERLSPVIYICRSDHLKSKPEDKHGNLQVHFDLKNANIIKWSAKSSNTEFENKLRKTLLHATRPIRQENQRKEELRSDRESFARRSQHEQTALVTQTSQQLLQSMGYRRIPTRSQVRMEGKHYLAHHVLIWKNNVGLVKQVGSTLICLPFPTCLPRVDDRLIELLLSAQGEFWNLYEFVSVQQASAAPQFFAGRRCKSIRRILILPILQKVSQNQISRVIPSWRKADSFSHYYKPDLWVPGDQSSSKASSSELIVIDGIKSLIEYRDTLAEVMRSLETNLEPIVIPRQLISSDKVPG